MAEGEKKKRQVSGKKKIIIIITALFVLLLSIFVSILCGSVHFSISEVFEYMFFPKEIDYKYSIIMNYRFPRILSGVLVGMNLAVAGTMLQAILRNPMASPNVIGVNSGAGFAAVLVMSILPEYYNLIPLAAFIGSLLASSLIFALAVSKSKYNTTTFIVLAGVAVSHFLKAATSGLMSINYEVLEITYSWLLGSLSGRSWPEFYIILPYSIIGLIAAIYISPKLNLFTLGDELATTVGLKTNLYRIIIILISSVLAGSAVSVAGTIGFVGLIAPHIAKILIGHDYKYTLIFSSILGGILLVIADTLARTLFLPLELNVGILTAILGGPFFLYLLIKKGNIV